MLVGRISHDRCLLLNSIHNHAQQSCGESTKAVRGRGMDSPIGPEEGDQAGDALLIVTAQIRVPTMTPILMNSSGFTE